MIGTREASPNQKPCSAGHERGGLLSKETEKLLNDAAARIPAELVHDIAQSMASFLAPPEMCSDSNRVSAYIERRLAPLIGPASASYDVRQALERIRRDARQGELWKEIPDEVVISFEIDRSALERTPVQP